MDWVQIKLLQLDENCDSKIYQSIWLVSSIYLSQSEGQFEPANVTGVLIFQD